ncbi:MAG: alpha/beta hydrolase, partial [Chitinophagales bacterium]|nr:alpha/beta hydrolase [Chitinophagales bacterium]MBP9796024.1 alpha/beta hydrolase [Chitinophagales bacterium]
MRLKITISCLLRAFVPLWLFLFLHNNSFSQVTIILKNASDFTPEIQNSIYIAGNFNQWNPGDLELKFKNENGKIALTFIPDSGITYLEFKFTRGTWETGEVYKDGGYRTNRSYFYTPGMLLELTVESFQDIAPTKVIEPNKDVIQFQIYSPELKREKNIRIYLPCDYKTSNKNYPVLYMLDGQNLFDDVYAYGGEWGVDENMDSICNLGWTTSIIVGIDHAGEKRTTEYSPWFINEEYGGGEGDEFGSFLTNTLKPKIDSMYRTKPQREFTSVAGSSMGGLMSLYIVLNHNDIFSKGGIFSPAFWTSKENFSNAENFVGKLPTKLFFICGAMEGNDAQYMRDMEAMYDILLNKKLANLQMRLVV